MLAQSSAPAGIILTRPRDNIVWVVCGEKGAYTEPQPGNYMKIRNVGLAAVIALFGFLVARHSRAQEEDLDSVKVCPETQKVAFENSFVRVIDDRIPPGIAERKHRHAHGVTVALTDYDIEQKNYQTGKVTRSHRSFGEINWSDPVIHDVRNIGATPSHAVRIELKY
jgi:hypothetical protein